jgi:hypothetical protein
MADGGPLSPNPFPPAVSVLGTRPARCGEETVARGERGGLHEGASLGRR